MKKIIYKLLICLFVIGVYAICLRAVESKASAPIPSGTYKIVSVQNENYVMDITGASKYDGANLELWENNYGLNQKFRVNSDGNGYYTISSVNSNKYLDVEMSGRSNGTNVIQYSYNGGDNQKWSIDFAERGFYIRSKCNGLCLDINGGALQNGNNIFTWVRNGGKNQMFMLEPDFQGVNDGTYMIASAANSNYVFDVTAGSRENNANIELWSNNGGGNNQKFVVKNIGNGYYTIRCGTTNKYLNVAQNSRFAGVNLEQNESNGSDSTKWLIKSSGDGYYYIVSKSNGLYVDVEGAAMLNGTNILMWNYNGGYNQRFKFIPTTLNPECNNNYTDNGRSAEFKKQHPEIKVGIDVSKFQGHINWTDVRNDGIDYVMVRAGFRGYGESGSLNVDPLFAENVTEARKAGLDVGIYFFSQAKNFSEGQEEAAYTIDLIKKYDITYPVAFDTEQSSSPTNTGRADNISVQDRTDAAKGFCSKIVSAGYSTLIYASPSWIKDNLYINQLSEYDIWLANYTGATQEDPLKRPSNYKGEYVMWQYTDSGTVNGVKGNVDCDLFYYLKMD